MSGILSVEKFTITMADGVGSATATLVASDVTKLTPRTSYRHTDSTEQGWDDMIVDTEFLTSPNRVQISRSGTDGEVIAEVVVIEWDTGGDITIQTGTFSTGGTSDDATVTAVDLAKTFAWVTYTSTFNGDVANSFVRTMLTSTTNLQILRIGTGGTVAGHWWLVEDGGSNFDVQRVQALSMAQTSASATITSVNTAKTLVMCGQSGTTTGENPDDLAIGFLTDSTTFDVTRDANAGTCVTDAFIIEWSSADVATQRGTITMGTGVETGTEANTAVTLAESFVHCPMAPNGCSSGDVTKRQAGFASIGQNSNIEVEANTNEDNSVEIVPWEILDFSEAAPVTSQPAIFFGMNF